MEKTPNYQLNQWEAVDRVQRTDFNADNAKIDAALAAIQDSVPYVKILEVTTQADAPSVDLDVSAIDFTAYRNVDLFCSYADVNHLVEVRVNGQTEGYDYGSAGGTGAGYHNGNLFGYLGGQFMFHTPHAGGKVGCVSFWGDSGFSGRISVARCTWDNLNSIQLSLYYGVIPSGTKISIYGLKK